MKQPRKEYLQDKKYRQEHKDEIKKYRQEHKEERNKYLRKYNKTPNGRLSSSKQKSRRRGYGDIVLMNNPFYDIDYDWHHLNNRIFVFPMPRVTHKYVGGSTSNDQHWIHNRMWIEKLYCIDVKNFLKGDV